MKNIQSVAIVGMGALGLLYGDHIMTHSSASVSYVMDTDRARKQDGTVFTINGRIVHPHCVASEATGPADLVILAVKYTGLESSLAVMAPCIRPDTILLSVMNGITSEDVIAERFGRSSMIYTVAQGMDAMKFGTELRYTQMGNLHMGITDPASAEDLESVFAFFDSCGMPYIREEDILRRMWFKYMLNVGINQVCMVFGTTYAGATNPGEANDVLISAMREVMLIANAKGVALTEQDIQTCIDIEKTLDPQGTPSMGQDRINRKPSEVEMFAGTVIRLGRECGIETPANEFLYRRVKEIEKEYVR